MSILPELLAGLAARLRDATGRAQRAEILREAAEFYGQSIGHLRRLVAGHGHRVYSRRSDAGQARSAEVEHAADLVANLILASHGDMPSVVAIQTAIDTQLIAADMAVRLRPHYVDRFIRAHGLIRRPVKGPAQSRKCKWGLPGETVQIDSTNCAQWFFPEEDGRIRYTADGEVYRNKQARTKAAPIIRYCAIDPPSGLFRVRYYQTAGESAEVLLDFLHWVMTPCADRDILPMFGVMRTLVYDGGPGNISSPVVNVCDSMGVERRKHLPGHSWAKGSVEQLMYLWQRAFESQLRLYPAASLDELNERAYRENCRFCSTRVLGRTGAVRSVYYARHAGERQLPPPWAIYREAAVTRPIERTVTGNTISYEGREYYIGGLAGVTTGAKVLVAKAVLDWDAETLPVRIYFGEGDARQCVIEKAALKDGRGQYVDQRFYTKRADPVHEARQQDRELRIAAAVEHAGTSGAPTINLANLPVVKAPAIRIARPVAAAVSPTYRLVPALRELRQRLGRDLAESERAQLGWVGNVTLAQIETAAQVLGTDAGADGVAANAG